RRHGATANPSPSLLAHRLQHGRREPRGSERTRSSQIPISRTLAPLVGGAFPGGRVPTRCALPNQCAVTIEPVRPYGELPTRGERRMAYDAEHGSDRGRIEPRTSQPPVDVGRRGFLKGAFAAGSVAASVAAGSLSSIVSAQAQPGQVPGMKNHYYVPATDKTV